MLRPIFMISASSDSSSTPWTYMAFIRIRSRLLRPMPVSSMDSGASGTRDVVRDSNTLFMGSLYFPQ